MRTPAFSPPNARDFRQRCRTGPNLAGRFPGETPQTAQPGSRSKVIVRPGTLSPMVTDDYRGLPKGRVRPVPEKLRLLLPEWEEGNSGCPILFAYFAKRVGDGDHWCARFRYPLQQHGRGGRLRGNISVVPITDSSPSAQDVQLQIQRAMPGEQRLLMALEMSQFARELAKERIRREHPDWPETQVARELVRLAFLPVPMPARLR